MHIKTHLSVFLLYWARYQGSASALAFFSERFVYRSVEQTALETIFAKSFSQQLRRHAVAWAIIPQLHYQNFPLYTCTLHKNAFITQLGGSFGGRECQRRSSGGRGLFPAMIFPSSLPSPQPIPRFPLGDSGIWLPQIGFSAATWGDPRCGYGVEYTDPMLEQVLPDALTVAARLAIAEACHSPSRSPFGQKVLRK
jgi:hypothetical protein